jgi:hypothetical protein
MIRNSCSFRSSISSNAIEWRKIAEDATYLCAPLNVRGVTLGLLHVNTDAVLTETQLQELRVLVMSVSESIKLALSNLKLQQVLISCTKSSI